MRGTPIVLAAVLAASVLAAGSQSMAASEARVVVFEIFFSH